ncbi:MAG TPA: hypothetical protein VKE74_36285, partial [Gemmataceae bacterium]|nr:hypothetical protein [Gemmataceae bacterium]
VTRAQKPGAGSAIRQAIEDRSDDVYLPLQTWRARFGTITFIQTDAGRVPESVDLDRIIITLPDPAQAEAVSGKIRKLLEPRHPIDDWAIGSR